MIAHLLSPATAGLRKLGYSKALVLIAAMALPGLATAASITHGTAGKRINAFVNCDAPLHCELHYNGSLQHKISRGEHRVTVQGVVGSKSLTLRSYTNSTTWSSLVRTVSISEGSYSKSRHLTGTVRGLVIPVEFADSTNRLDQPALDQLNVMFNSTSYVGPERKHRGSIRQFYSQVSGGRLTLTHRIAPTVRLTARSLDGFDFVRAALDAYVAAGGNFNGLSLNEEGEIESLAFITTGNLNHTWGNFKFNTNYTIQGVRANAYAHSAFIDPLQPPLTGMAHEIGHSAMRWPDLYGGNDAGDNDPLRKMSNALGRHDLMSDGTATDGVNPLTPNHYLRGLNGWGTATDLTRTATARRVSLTMNSGNHYRVRNPHNPKESIVIGATDNTGSNFFAGMPSKGLMIWHIDEDESGNHLHNHGFNKYSHFQIYLEQADGSFQLDKRLNKGDQGDAFTGASAIYSDTTTPNAKWWDGTTSGLSISNVTIDGSTLSFDYTLKTQNLSRGYSLVADAGRCLNVSATDGALVELVKCSPEGEARWWFSSAGQIINSFGHCLEIQGPNTSSNGARIRVAGCSSTSTTQKWRLGLNGEFINRANNKCMDIASSTINSATAIVEIWDCNGGLNQRWRMQDIKRKNIANFAQPSVQLNNQTSEWLLEEVDGHYRLHHRWLNKYFHMDGGTLQLGNINAEWHSAHWKVIAAKTTDGKNVFLLKNRWLSDQFLYLDSAGALKAGPATGKKGNWPEAYWTMTDRI